MTTSLGPTGCTTLPLVVWSVLPFSESFAAATPAWDQPETELINAMPNGKKPNVETALEVIEERLSWHKLVGWGAIGIFTAVFIYLLTWYLPKELSNYPTKADLKDVSGKVDVLSTKLDNLSENLNKFMALRIGGLIPSPDKAKKLSTTQLSANLHQATLLVDAALQGEVPADPALLVSSRVNLRSIIKEIKLPLAVEKQALSAFAHVDTYESFSKNVLSERPIVKAAPPKPEGPVKAIIVVSLPTTLAKFSVIDFAGQGIEFVHVPPDFQGDVVAYDLRIVGLKQDLSRIKWLNVTFESAEITYDGGPLLLEGVIFRDCKFKFGTDQLSKQVLALINQAESTPVSINSEFL